MIKKILLFSDNRTNWGGFFKFAKSPGSLRLSYDLRKKGYIVKQVHCCISFTTEELDKIITDFSNGEEIIAGISTSFLLSEPKNNNDKWGGETYDFLMRVLPLLKSKNVKVLMGGFLIKDSYMKFEFYRKNFSIPELSQYVDYFVEGSSTNTIEKVCKGETFDYNDYGHGCKVAISGEIEDYSDAAYTPTKEDNIFEGESLTTELASGCIFSCQFCNYGSLGKKKNEYMRSYDSLEREIISNHENFGTRVYTLSDNIVNDNVEKLKWLIKIKEKTGIDLRWVGFVRPDTIYTKDQVQLLKDSGIAAAVCGIESLKKEVGPTIGKVTDPNRIKKSLEIFRSVIGDYAIIQASFVTGLPTETPEDWYRSFEWLSSEEGTDFLDVIGFNPFYLWSENKDKNSINIGRNDPFKDYVGQGDQWTSPWGSQKLYADLANELNSKKLPTSLTAWMLPYANNVGLPIEDSIRIVRTSKNLSRSEFIDMNKKVINGLTFNQAMKIVEYKKKVINNGS